MENDTMNSASQPSKPCGRCPGAIDKWYQLRPRPLPGSKGFQTIIWHLTRGWRYVARNLHRA